MRARSRACRSRSSAPSRSSRRWCRNNFDEITVEENQCMSCHGLENYRKKNAPKVGDSHLTFSADGTKKVVTMDRYQCNTCHVPQVDAKPLVDNTFVGNIPPKQ